MDNSNTMSRLRLRVESARAAVDIALRRAGRDPSAADAIPEYVEPGSGLAHALARWREADQLLTAAEERSPTRW